MYRVKKQFPLLVLIVTITIGVLSLVYLYKENRVNDILNEQSTYLKLSYQQGLDRFSVIGENVYLSLQNDVDFLEILGNDRLYNLKTVHDKLYQHLEEEYIRLKLSGIMGLHIVSPQNISIVRMHKEEKFGDDVGSIRPMIKAVNEDKVYKHGFEEGKSSHAFREVYPLYYNGIYIGAVEILFSSTKLQDYTMRASNIHTHFIVNKNVLNIKEWKSVISEPYEQSIEHTDFLFSMNDHINHSRLDKSQKSIINPLREFIDKNIGKDEPFSSYVIHNKMAKVISFYPVKRFIDGKTLAYIVSYTDCEKLYDLNQFIELLYITLGIAAIIIYLIILKLLSEKESILNELKYDALTNVYNRKYFMNYLNMITKKTDKKFCLVMVDIDHFKHVNDTYGHQYGDEVLKEFGEILKTSLRDLDLVARYGGEEFILCLFTDEKNTKKVTENIRQRIEMFEFGEQSIGLSASFGVAEYQNEDSVETVIKRADKALYIAKESGRNRVVVG